MQEKIIKNSKKISLETRKDYYWCDCGLSKDGIFCDGSHKTTNFEPMKFTVAENKAYFLCSCKKTKNKPYCDGSHSKN